MKLILSTALFAALLVGAFSPAYADKETEGKIEARQGYYQLVWANAGPLFSMAKGDVDYDAEVAAQSAQNLKLLATMNNLALWPANSSNEDMPGKTRALKAIWDTWPAIGDTIGQYNLAVDGLVTNAGNGVDALRANVGALGAACEACHKNYRADKF